MARRRTTFTWLIPLALFLLAWYFGKFTTIAYPVVGMVLLVLGEVVRFWSAGCIHKDNVVATTGPYAFARNPLYFGSFLLSLGYGALAGFEWIGVVGVFVLFLIFHLAAIFTEEASLKVTFGEPYLEYMRHVPRLFPRLFPYRDPNAEKISFSWSQVVYNREPTSAIVTFVTALLFIYVQYYHWLNAAANAVAPSIIKGLR